MSDNKQLARQLRLSIDGQTFVVGKEAEQVEAIYERAFASARRKDAAELTRLRAFPVTLDTPHEVCDGIITMPLGEALALHGYKCREWVVDAKEVNRLEQENTRLRADVERLCRQKRTACMVAVKLAARLRDRNAEIDRLRAVEVAARAVVNTYSDVDDYADRAVVARSPLHRLQAALNPDRKGGA